MSQVNLSISMANSHKNSAHVENGGRDGDLVERIAGMYEEKNWPERTGITAPNRW
jgi:hypothetical protein